MRTRSFWLLIGWLAALPGAGLRAHPAHHSVPNSVPIAARARGVLPSRHAVRPLIVPASANTFASGDPLAWDRLTQAGKPAASAPAAKTAPAAARLWQMAEADYREGRVDSALSLYQAACRLAPRNARLHERIADLCYESGQRAAAMAEYRATLRLEPADANSHWGLGIALLETDSAEAGIAECRTALRLKPGDAAMHNSLGLALYQKGQKAEARQEWQAALLLRDPDGSDCARRYLTEFPP